MATHTIFKTQEAYDKNHAKIKELKKDYLSKKINESNVKEILKMKFGYSNWGADHFIQTIKDEIEANKKRTLEIKKIQKLIKFNRNPDEVSEMKDHIKYLENMIEETK